MDPAYSGLKRWLFTTHHKDVGILYFVTSLSFGAIAAVFGQSMRIQLAVPGNTFLGPGLYNQFLTMHGLLMILWFLSPLELAFANYFVPLQIGAKDLAYPRLNALSYWLYLGSGILMLGGSANGGWTSYSPLTSTCPTCMPDTRATLSFVGLIMLAVSITIGSVNFLATIFHLRAPGITIRRIPMFTWFVLCTIIMMLFAFPVLIAGLIMLIADRLLATTFFTNAAAGVFLWLNLFWAFGHPEVYIVLMPASGAIAEILPVFSRRPLAGREFIRYAAMFGVVPLSMVVWGHHMFTTGMNLTAAQAFSITTIAISIPFDVILIHFIRTTTHGSVRFKTPMLFAIGSIILFVVGGIAGVFLSSYTLNLGFRGGYWVTGHFHYVMVGETIFGLFAAIYYWLPKMTGRMYNETLGRIHFILSFIGFNLLYFPMFILFDMPRRYFTYPADTGWGTPNLIMTIGATIFTTSQLLLVANLVNTWRRGAPASPNPWGSLGPEWGVILDGPAGSYMFNGAAPAPTHTAHEYVTRHFSHRPITLSVGLGLTLAGLPFMTSRVGIPIFFAGLAVLAWAIVGWFRDDLRGRFLIPTEKEGERWPFSGIPKLTFGMWMFVASDILFFGSLIASYIFIRVNIKNWPPPGTVHNIPVGTIMTLVLLLSSFGVIRAVLAIRNGNRRAMLQWLIITFALGAAFLLMEGVEWYDLRFGPLNFWFDSGLAGGTFFLITGIHGSHVAAGLLITLYLIVRTLKGGFSKENHQTVELFGLYWHFVDIVWVFLFPLFFLILGKIMEQMAEKVSSPATILVIAYLIVATLAEVYLYNIFRSGAAAYASIAILAISKATLIIAYYMELRFEPLSLRAFTGLSLSFLLFLIIIMVFTLVH